VPGLGWLDFDPTNNVLPNSAHVTVAWGRDFSDVSPLKGVVLGGGAHSITVSVDVERVDATSN
jgi:transglutaminase-like putative cysteine protease